MRRHVLALAMAIGCGANSAGAPDSPGSDGRPPDAARGDATLVDAPPGATDVPAVACTGSAGDVYAATATPGAALGTILACAPSQVLDQAAVQTAIGSAIAATTQVSTFLVAYQTRAGDGSPAVSTARAYLPHVPRAYPAPIVAAGHGSVGLADACVPSAGIDDNLPLPYAAQGFVAIAPDLAGLGNAGTQDYEDNRSQGWELLDSVRALRALLAPGVTAPSYLLAGYSQGGGDSLSAQALARADGADLGELVATVVFAPEWPIRLDSFGYVGILDNPTELTISTGLSRSSIAVLRQYAYFENWVGAGTGPTSLPSQFRTAAQAVIDSQCLVEVGGYIQGQMLHASDLIDETLREGLVACMAGSGSAAGCTGTAEQYYNFMVANVIPPDPQAGPVLIVQGLADQIMAPANEAACIDQELVSDGVDVSTCVLPLATHTDIMNNAQLGLAWAESVFAGGARASCATAYSLPTCQP